MTTTTLGPIRSADEQVDRYNLDQPLGKGPFTFSTGDEVVVSGWAFVAGPGPALASVVLEVVNTQTGVVTRVDCERVPRPDVVEHFSNPGLLSSGFIGRFSLDPSFQGAHTVRLLQTDGKRAHSSAQLFSFTVAPASIEADARRHLATKFLTGSGLEIGALQRRLETPRYCTVRYVDRMPLDELRAHYPELRDLQLQTPDLIDDGETLTKVATGSQDFVIANHFLEHCENPIKTLGNLARVLKEGGVLYMAVPDKRFTFDVGRPVTPYHVLAEARRLDRRSDREFLYREWAAYVMRLAPADVDAAARKLLDEQYSIHFNVWALPDLLEFLVRARAEFALPFVLEWVVSSENEVILMLRKQEPSSVRLDESPESMPVERASAISERDDATARVQQLSAELLRLQAERGAMAADYRRVLAANESLAREIASLDTRAAEASKRCSRLEAETGRLRKQTRTMTKALRRADKHRVRLASKLDLALKSKQRLASELNIVRKSKSWRLTAPLRRLVRAIR